MSEPATVRDPRVQERALRLASGLVAPFARMARQLIVGSAASAAAGLAVGLATHQPASGAAVGAVLSVGVALIAWWPFVRPGFRAAAELFYDHDCHERALWKKETGTSMPGRIPAIERWLRTHPEGTPGRASLLLVTGRLAEFDQVLAARDPRDPEERFEVELLRETRALLVGGTAAVAKLREHAATIPNPREQRHRLECVALLEAQVAVGEGANPIPVLARARAGIPEVYWSMRASSLLVKWSLIPVALVSMATMISMLAG